MLRFIALLLSCLLVAAPALADLPLPEMATEDLIALRDAISTELRIRQLTADLEALRAGTASASDSVTLGPVTISLVKVEIGEGRDNSRAVGVILSADNAGDSTLTMNYDVNFTLRQGGAECATTWVKSESFDSDSVSGSLMTKLYPGAHGILLYEGGKLMNDSNILDIEVFYSDNKVRTLQLSDPYIGRFSVDLSALQ